MDTLDKMQDDSLVKDLLREQTRLEGLRAPWESIWRDIDERVNPLGGGGWNGKEAPGKVRGQYNFDATAIEGLDKFVAAIAGITIPRAQRWHGLKFADRELNKLPNVRRWCERATDRMFDIRYAPLSAFETQALEGIRQLGSYGTTAFYICEEPGLGLVYKSVHLSEIWIDENFRGLIDTVHRKYTRTARQCREHFGEAALTPKMAKAIGEGKGEAEFELLHVVRPNPSRNPEAFDWRGKPIDSIHLCIDEKIIMKRSGFYSSPFAVSRNVTGPGDVYGRSPALKVLGTIMGVNQMARTILRAGQKATDPAYGFFSDDGVTRINLKPGSATPGLVNENGQLLVQPIPTGGDPRIGVDMLQGERGVIKEAFLESVFKLVTDETVQRSATAVLEIAAKTGVLVAPFAGRYETENLGPTTMRELDLGLRAGQVEPLPPEVIEAGAVPLPQMDNPLSKMARMQEAAGLTRLIEVLAPFEASEPGITGDVIDMDAAGPGVADVLNVRQSWTRSPEEIRARRAKRDEAKAAAASVQDLATVAGATADFAKANSYGEGVPA
jgi:hypothetical protein